MAVRVEPAGIGLDRVESPPWFGWTEPEPESSDPAGLWSDSRDDVTSDEWPDEQPGEYGSAWTGIP